MYECAILNYLVCWFSGHRLDLKRSMQNNLLDEISI